MSVEHMDNFSLYGGNTAFMTQGIYAQANGSLTLQNDPDGVSPGKVMRMTSSAASQGLLRYVLAAATAKVGHAVRVWMNNLPTSTNDRPSVCSYRSAVNAELATVKIETTGRLTFTDGVNTFTTVNPVITANAWWHIEVWYDRSGVGSIEIRVEGVTVMNEANLGYAGAAATYQFATHFAGSNFSATAIYFKDWVLANGFGTYNNTFMGSVLVAELLPTGDAALNWTPVGAANGFSILDNVPPNDAIYLAAPTPAPAPYVANLSNLPPDVTSVKALMTMVRAAKSGGGDGSFQVSMISNGDTGNGANRPITTAQTYWRDVFEVDPDTAAPWTPVAVDAAQMQLNRTT